ncbi:uncharacterized protein LOC116351649, partial [Contarinia nasturtii]|uniref:uncharacterized protein LOC116351649 n=1 Tax=Contarinia nasturtii TaxID=265458 RepID=UPI0012D3F86B
MSRTRSREDQFNIPPERKDDIKNLVVIKQGVKSIIREEYRDRVIQFLDHRSYKMTLISSLASLLALYKIQEAIDDGNQQFFVQNGKTFFIECFNGVLADKVDREELMPPAFRNIVEAHFGVENFEWPDKECLGNGFNYFYQDHIRNNQTNLNTHCSEHVESFFQMKRWYYNMNINGHQYNGSKFDGIDIRNAKVYATSNKDLTHGDVERTNKMNILLYELERIGWQCQKVHNEQLVPVTVNEFVKDNWFQSLWMFGQMQRQIEVFHQYSQQWHAFRRDGLITNNRPPKVNNFALVPLCRFQLKNVRLDMKDMYYLANTVLGVVPSSRNPLTNRMNKYTLDYYMNGHRDELWNLVFDMDKIKQIGKQKRFHSQIITNSVCVSILYEKPAKAWVENSEQATFNNMTYASAIDPNEKTWVAVVRRHINSNIEENIKISNPRFHWQTEQKKRDRKADRLTWWFVEEEQMDFKSYPVIPSPRGSTWKAYILHRIKMLRMGMQAYATRKYARLDLDHHIKATKTSDKVAMRVTNNKPSWIWIGAGEMAPNRPWGIKKRKRCPGTRKLATSFKKQEHTKVSFQDEWGTSITCANCHERFPRETKNHRFKICRNCIPKPIVGLPPIIVTNLSRQELKKERIVERAINPDRENIERLVPKIKVIFKTWSLTREYHELGDAEPEDMIEHVVIWHRDIVAAKNILFK